MSVSALDLQLVGRRVLILTSGHLCRNPRVLKEATSLGQAGFDVTVIGVRTHQLSDQIDSRIAAQAPFKLRSLNLLPGQGWESFCARARIRMLRDFTARGLVQTIGSIGPASALLGQARRTKADLTICHNEVAHWLGVQLMKEGRTVAADIEDWHSEDLLPADRHARPLGLLREVERTMVNRCVYATTTSHALAEGLHHRYDGKRPAVITNSFPLQPNPLRASPPESGPVRLFWFSQTLGPGRGLEGFLAAWTRWETPSTLTLLGEDRSGFRAHLLSLIPVERRSNVLFRDPVPPDDLPTLIAEHDIGLALEDPSIPNRDLTITNKILQYLNAGLAILATSTVGQREVLSRAPAAGELFPTGDVDACLAALRKLGRSRTELLERRRASRNLAETVYCWEREEPRLLELVSRALRQAGVKR
jgi:glycosyltransferase involved in cell wall biosynthesis